MTTADFSHSEQSGSFREWLSMHSRSLALIACVGFWVAVSTTLYLAI
jgi:hypothetical protein